MKLEIHKLQVTQYGHSEVDNSEAKSEVSFNSNIKSNQLTSAEEPKRRHPSSGFDLPQGDIGSENRIIRSPGSSGNLSEKKVYHSTDTKKSLISVGKSVVGPNSYSIYSAPMTDKPERNKEKQKILAKL